MSPNLSHFNLNGGRPYGERTMLRNYSPSEEKQVTYRNGFWSKGVRPKSYMIQDPTFPRLLILSVLQDGLYHTKLNKKSLLSFKP